MRHLILSLNTPETAILAALRDGITIGAVPAPAEPCGVIGSPPAKEPVAPFRQTAKVRPDGRVVRVVR